MQSGGKGFTQAKPAGRRSGFTLVEAVMVVFFIGILAAIAVPRLNLAIVSKHQAKATARIIVTDLRRTRQLNISNAATHTLGYELVMDGSDGPDTRPSYLIHDRDADTSIDSHTFPSEVTVWSDVKKFRFGPLGNILQSETGAYPTEITVSAEGKTFTIGFVVATGMITCTENE